ncbi:MAG: site-specific integrase [Clostridia bacterium]|nr:site-specific integrase [Clostridia bacterium]
MTIKEYLTDWHNSREVLLKKSTFEAEGIYLTKHIIPYFAEVCPELENLKPVMVQNYTRTKLKGGRMDGQSGGLSLVSVRKHFAILKQALDEAVMLEYLDHNPAASVRLPKRSTAAVAQRTVFLTTEEAQRLLDGIKEHSIYPAVALALLYGLRRSEVLGLRWDAINFDRGTITICHTVVKNLTVRASDTTKTENSRRTFQMLPEVRSMLEDLKAKSPKGSQYLFCHDDGSVWRPDCLTRTFQRQLKRLELPQMRFHDLRHSTASILFDRGWSLEDVKNWLGHADIETTSNIYLHYGRTRKVLLANDLVGMLDLVQNTQKSL